MEGPRTEKGCSGCVYEITLECWEVRYIDTRSIVFIYAFSFLRIILLIVVLVSVVKMESPTLQELTEHGRKMELKGTDLQKFILDQQTHYRELRAAERSKEKEERESINWIEKECLAIVWSVQKFLRYLYGREFLLETDHQPLVYLTQAKVSNARLMRWALLLQPYRFRIISIKGSDNVGADCLSRL